MTTTLSDDELALLRSVCAHPDDDTPRLVYADWLDDQGDRLLALHAAFIREQVRWARGRETFTDSEYVENGRRQHHLLLTIAHWEGSDWSAGNALSMRLMDRTVGGTGYTRPERWDRGFPARVTFRSVTAYQFAAGFDLHGDRLYDRVPVIETRVRGRVPWSGTFLDGRPAACWRKSARGHLFQPSELRDPVFRQLTHGNEYPSARAAQAAGWLAFTDAGRVQSGLAPRFKGVIDAVPATVSEREGAA